MAVKNMMLAAAMSAVAIAAPALEERQSCSSTWGQCGGNGWSGATCCESGTTCVYVNDWYSQCLPDSQVTTTTTTTSETTSQAPSSSTTSSVPTTTSEPASTTTAPTPTGDSDWTGNPFDGVQMWANEYYASEVSNLAVPQLSDAMATAAAKVADVPSFMWMDTYDKIERVRDTLADIRDANNAGASPPYAGIFVVYDLPDRDCAAAASNGEYAIADDGINKYKAYIDAIREMLEDYSDTRVLLVIEPDSLANMVTNLNVAKCSNAQSAYEECTVYALQQLNLPNVAMYMDAGHAGWLGWPANQQPAADLYARIYQEAGSPSQVRGLATNVANYNGWNITSAPSYTQGNSVYNEKQYVEVLGPMLSANGFDAQFIVDQGRSGKQPTGQTEWGHWCNAIGTGFGLRPSSNTGHSLVDAFVWIKPGGECDGTSDTSAERYDYHCGLSDALQPAPEAGEWFQAYFEQLLTNANPSFL